MSFQHYSPRSLEEALDLIAAHRSNGKLLAGGTDLVPRLNAGMGWARHLISLNRVKGMNGITYMEDDGLVVGGTARVSAVGAHPQVQKHYPDLAHACSVMATPQVRNMATVAGNIANSAPSADTAGPLLVHGASLILVERGGRRVVDLQDFFTGPGQNTLEPYEIIEAIRVPAPPERSASAYMRLSARSKVDIAAVGVAGFLVVGLTGEIIKARVALSSVAPTPVRAREAEEMLTGQKPDAGLMNRAAAACVRACRPIDDMRATAAYRRSMVNVLARRVLLSCYHKVEGGAK